MRGFLHSLRAGSRPHRCRRLAWFQRRTESVEEAIALEEFEKGGGLASRDDEAVDIGQFVRGADQLCRYGESSEGFGVGLECSLQGEHTYSKRSAGLRRGCHVLWFCSLSQV